MEEELKRREDEYSYVTFKVDGESFGVDLGAVKEVTDVVPEEYLDRDCNIGLLNLRGMTIPVFNISRIFNDGEEGKRGGKVLIVSLSGIIVGLGVDSVHDVEVVPSEEIFKPPLISRGVRGGYIWGAYRRGGDLDLLLDLSEVIPEETLKRLTSAMKGRGSEDGGPPLLR